MQLRRVKGWSLPANTISVARPGRWGNPFRVELVGRDRAISAFRDLLEGFFSGPNFADLTDAQFKQMYDEAMVFQRRHGLWSDRTVLRGKNLACWCAPHEACHADVLLEWANGPRRDG